jgi:hypothetical protein
MNSIARILSITTWLIIALSCIPTTSTWQLLDFGPFSIKTPKGWSIVKRQGLDKRSWQTNENANPLLDHKFCTVTLSILQHQ